MTPLIFSQPQIPPSKEFAKKTKEPPPPLDFQLLCIYGCKSQKYINVETIQCQPKI
jgi:hypothetical protein